MPFKSFQAENQGAYSIFLYIIAPVQDMLVTVNMDTEAAVFGKQKI
jgi:hypothetical protein